MTFQCSRNTIAHVGSGDGSWSSIYITIFLTLTVHVRRLLYVTRITRQFEFLHIFWGIYGCESTPNEASESRAQFRAVQTSVYSNLNFTFPVSGLNLPRTEHLLLSPDYITHPSALRCRQLH